MRLTNFGNTPRYTQIHHHQNEYDTEVKEMVPKTQQSNPTPESNTTSESNPTELKDKVDTSLDYKMKKLDLQLENKRMIDYNFFISSHEHLRGPELAVTKVLKEEIRIKYNW